MTRAFFLHIVATALLLPAGVSAQGYFQQFVHYTIHARLDTDNRMLTGSEDLLYRNESPDTLREIYFHLYPNAYRGKESALIQDYARRFNGMLWDLPDDYRSYLKIFDVEVDGTPVGAPVDDTIARVALPNPLPPGDSLRVTMKFEEKIRKHLGRAGYKDDHYDIAQWYPKIVVYDEDGWHPDKFMRGEFYGEFGNFDVSLEVPEDYVVVATGVVKDGDPGWTPTESRRRLLPRRRSRDYKTVHFSAENVHDFAWCADPDFIVEHKNVGGTDLYSVFREKNEKAWSDSTLAHVERALKWMEEKVGPYPYPHLTVVDALLTGGMEYPMLAMDGKVDEDLVVHEVAHIYFYGLLANNERTEAWLDEGFATFMTAWYEEERYGPHGITRDWNWYQHITPQFTERGELQRKLFPLLRKGYGERIAMRAEEFQNSYRAHVYYKAALMLYALRYVIGEDNFESALKTYYERWQFKHVNEARFQQVCEEVSGRDLDWFFETWLYSRKLCDYQLADVKTEPSASGDAYTTTVTIERIGELVMPIEVVFTFKDGTTQRSRIEGRLRTIKSSFNFPERPVKVALNPDNYVADINMSDNFIPRRRSWNVMWPNNPYYPEWATQVRYRPGVWYNDVDGVRVGVHLRRSRARYFTRLHLAAHYAIDSHRLDFESSMTKTVGLFSYKGDMYIGGYKLEGHQDFDFHLDISKRLTLIRPPTQRLLFGFNYHELTKLSYAPNPEKYQVDPDFAPYFGYEVDPQYDIIMTKVATGLRLGRDWFGAKFDYSQFFLEGSLRTRPKIVPFDAGARMFLGLVGGSMPRQRKFFLAGGGPVAADQRFWLRAPGAVPEDLNYHEPGHGNLRGYLEGDFGVNQLFALNAELGHRVPLLSKKPTKFLGEIKLTAFADVGWTFDDQNPIQGSQRIQDLTDAGVLNKTLADAGIGASLHRTLPFYDLFVRFDVPIYVSQPIINGETDTVDFRYLLSLSATF